MNPAKYKEIRNQRTIGYNEAALIDTNLNELLEKYPIKEHIHLWETLTRTLMTSLDIVRYETQKAKLLGD